MTNFNKLLILLSLLLVTTCMKVTLAHAEDCYPDNSLGHLQELSAFTRKNIEQPWTQFDYNGRSVTASEYERLKLRDRNLPKNVDPGERMP